MRTDSKDEVLEQGSSPGVAEDGGLGGGRVGKRASGIRSANQQPAASIALPPTPQLPQPGQLSLVVASVVQGKGAAGDGGSGTLTLQLTQQLTQQESRGNLGSPKVSCMQLCAVGPLNVGPKLCDRVVWLCPAPCTALVW